MKQPFLGRSLAVIDDLSREERMYLFSKTRELKDAVRRGDRQAVNRFRIQDESLGIYEVFLEDSTRTRESFKNAAKFHNCKISTLSTDSSSFNKGESYSDTFNTLAGYDNSIFIIRSKLEGVCRWLELSGDRYARRMGLSRRPSFINAGDGKHEHPTQELLDEFTFLEDNAWSTESIHVALVGDLFHGRTVHSKVDGLSIFKQAVVDLVAPDELALPDEYLNRMKDNGFTVRTFPSIRAYLDQPTVADKWYFTRPQLERMGEQILRRQDELREAVTFSRDLLGQLPPDTIFYHPLPRNKVHPVIPAWLDETPLNGWERQSANGMLVRIVLLAMISGHLGDDYTAAAADPVSRDPEQTEYVQAVDPVSRKDHVKQYSEGVQPIRSGTVIDHICRGDSSQEIRRHMHLIVSLLGLHGKGGEWVSTSQQEEQVLKGIIFRPGYGSWSEDEIKRLAAAAPGSTLNIIEEGRVTAKYRLSLPPLLTGLPGLACRNDLCISHPSHDEAVVPRFNKTREGYLTCEFCGRRHSFKEVWMGRKAGN
jgi:aspartate carbamoyltransferase